jgi:pimeloyl-ACP methyl ester carboxylesterase
MTNAVALLLPGMTLNTTIFPDLGLPTIAGEFTRLVLGPDGISPELTRDRMGLYARKLDDIVAAAPDWSATRRIVVAHSFGGMLALYWLATAGDNPLRRVDGVVLIGTTAGPMFDVVEPRLGPVRLPVGWIRWVWFNATVTRLLDAVLGRGGARRRVDFQRIRFKTDLWAGYAGWHNTDWRARRSYRSAMDGFDVRDKLSGVTVPVIVLHGTKDVFFPLAVAQDLQRRLPQAELRVVQGAPHVLSLTHGDQVIRAVTDLVNGLPR